MSNAGGTTSEATGTAPVKLYAIEERHLSALKDVGKRLYDGVHGTSLSPLEMGKAALSVMEIVRFAEALDALRKPGQPHVHLYPKED